MIPENTLQEFERIASESKEKDIILALVKELRFLYGRARNAENLTVGEVCTAILNWADAKNPHFDTRRVEDILLDFEKHGRITDQQRKILENIVVRFRINVTEWL